MIVPLFFCSRGVTVQSFKDCGYRLCLFALAYCPLTRGFTVHSFSRTLGTLQPENSFLAAQGLQNVRLIFQMTFMNKWVNKKTHKNHLYQQFQCKANLLCQKYDSLVTYLYLCPSCFLTEVVVGNFLFYHEIHTLFLICSFWRDQWKSVHYMLQSKSSVCWDKQSNKRRTYQNHFCLWKEGDFYVLCFTFSLSKT